jgi:hypothetical protein
VSLLVSFKMYLNIVTLIWSFLLNFCTYSRRGIPYRFDACYVPCQSHPSSNILRSIQILLLHTSVAFFISNRKISLNLSYKELKIMSFRQTGQDGGYKNN